MSTSVLDVDTTTVTTAHTEPAHTLVGTMALVRAFLRQDRVKLPSWVAGFAAFSLYVGLAIPVAYPTEADLESALALLADPAGRLLTGPAYGFDDVTYERVVANGYGLYLILLAALMAILTVTRHTRLEEQTGRYELVRAAVVGRHAPLTATLVVAATASVAAGVAVTAVFGLAAGFGFAGSALTGAMVVATGVCFAGVAALTAQVTQQSRASSGLAGIVLGAAFVLRAVGDMSRVGGGALSWLSPLGWAQQTAPFVLDRWWPLAPVVALGAATASVGFALSSRRDLGAGLVTGRPGRPAAGRLLGDPWGLAVRLQRASVVAWTTALAVSGLVFGVFADTMGSAVDDMPEAFRRVFGTEDLVDGYLAYMAAFMGYLVAAYAVLGVQGLRHEETAGRVTPVLAAPVSRWAWMGAGLGVTAAGAAVALVITGLASGVGAAVVTGDPSVVGALAIAHLAQLPAVLAVLALAALLLGWAPRAVAAVWAVVGFAVFAGTFGAMLELPSWVTGLSPFDHLTRMPLEPFGAASSLVLSALAASLVGLGLMGFRRRDLDVT